MNLFNRIVVIVLCLLLATAAVAVITLAWSAPGDSIDWLRDASGWLDTHNEDLEKALLTTIGALAALLAVVVLALELTPSSGTDVQVTDVQVGDAVLSTTAIGQRVEEAVAQVPHVAEARASVRTKRKGVQVALDLHVDPEANLAAVADEACAAARDVLTQRVHVALVEPPRARLHYRELRLRGRGPQPAPEAASEAPAGEEPQPLDVAPPPADAGLEPVLAGEAEEAAALAGTAPAAATSVAVEEKPGT